MAATAHDESFLNALQKNSVASSLQSSIEPTSPQNKKQSDGANPKPEQKKNKGPKSKSIGHYMLGRTLGEGTFGKVKLGTHILTGEKVAVKILEKDRIKDVADVERVTRQIHILKLVRHPCIIQLYEIIETHKQLYLIMEYANGGQLFDYIVKNSRVKEREASKFFLYLVSGVEYIHRLRIVHRDLKPENLLLDVNKRVKIVDFGLSNTYKEHQKLKTACGSPCYAAPEMIAGKKYEGLMADIWSCGVILFALVCGYLPFEDPNTSQLYKKILAANYSIPKFVSPECKDLMKKILVTDPTQRYSIQDIRNHQWTKVAKTISFKGIVVGQDPIPVDTQILFSLQQYKFNPVYVQKCLECNKHNHATTSYYLLLKRHLTRGGKSPADIASEDYDPDKFKKEVGAPPPPHYPPITFYNKPPKQSDKLNTTFATIPRERQLSDQRNRAGSTGGSSSKETELTFITKNSGATAQKKQSSYRADQLSQSPPRQFFNSFLQDDRAKSKRTQGAGGIVEDVDDSIYAMKRPNHQRMATTAAQGFQDFRKRNTISPSELTGPLPNVTRNYMPPPPASAKPASYVSHRQEIAVRTEPKIKKINEEESITLPLNVSPRGGSGGALQSSALRSTARNGNMRGVNGGTVDYRDKTKQRRLQSFLTNNSSEERDLEEGGNSHKQRVAIGIKQREALHMPSGIGKRENMTQYPRNGKPITAITKLRIKKNSIIQRAEKPIFSSSNRPKKQGSFEQFSTTLFTMYKPKIKEARNKSPLDFRPGGMRHTSMNQRSRHGAHFSLIQHGVQPLIEEAQEGDLQSLGTMSFQKRGGNYHAQQAYNIAMSGGGGMNSKTPRGMSALDQHIQNLLHPTTNRPYNVALSTKQRGSSSLSQAGALVSKRPTFAFT